MLPWRTCARQLWCDLTDEQRALMKSPDLRKRVNVRRSTLPAITHVDMSARIQTVDEKRHGRYYRLMKEFKRQTGCGVIINTSFNIRGEPIVCTPQDACRCFMATEMDMLVLENCVLRRSEQPQQDQSARKKYIDSFQLDRVLVAYGQSLQGDELEPGPAGPEEVRREPDDRLSLPGAGAAGRAPDRLGVWNPEPSLWVGGVGFGLGLVFWLVPSDRKAVLSDVVLSACCIGIVISNVLLIGFFLLVVTPIGLLLRAVGKAPLRKSMDKSAATYWEEAERVTDVKRYYSQF